MKVSRYNPETNRKKKVCADSPEASSWPTKKPAKTFVGATGQVYDQYTRAGLGAAATYAGAKVAQKVERKVVQAVGGALRKGSGVGVGVLAEAAGASVAATAATIIAGAIAGYGLGKAITYATDPDRIIGIALRQLHEAQNAVRQRLGRELTKAEAKKLFDAYQLTLARSLAGDPTIGIRPGME